MRLVLSLLIVLLTSTICYSNTRDGLVGWWNLDEISGTTAVDSSWKGNTGTASNTLIVSNCQTNTCRSFNGTTSYIDAGSATILDDIPQITVSAWIYPSTSGELGTGKIVSKRGDVAALSGWNFGMSGSSLNWSAEFSVTLATRTTSTTVTLNKWTHVVLTWDGSSTAANAKMYINTVEAGYSTTTNGSGTRSSDAAKSLTIGNLSSAAERTFDGFIDDVKIYNRIITTQEVKDLYNQGVKRNTVKLNY